MTQQKEHISGSGIMVVPKPTLVGTETCSYKLSTTKLTIGEHFIITILLAHFYLILLLFSNLKVIALMATITVEIDIRTAPKAGANVIPIGAKIPAAIGIAIKL